MKKTMVLLLINMVLFSGLTLADAKYGETYEEICTGASCVRTLYGGVAFYQLSNGTWVRTEDAFVVSFNSGLLNISFPDVGEEIIYRTYINASGVEYALSDYVNLINGSEAKFVAEKKRGSWHWYANITGLDTVKDNIESVSFKKVSSVSSESYDSHVKDYGRLRIDFSDLIKSRFVISNNQGNIVITNVTGKPSLHLDPAVLLTGGVANLTGKCGQKATVAATNPYPAGTVNASQTWYNNVGAVDDTITKFNNNGINECDGGANFVTGQLNWSLRGIKASEVDSFNFTYVHGSAWDYNMVISLSFRNTSADDWTDALRRPTPDDPSHTPYWASINLTNQNGAGNLFIDNGEDSYFIVAMNSSMGNSHGIQFDYLSLTVAWTEQSGVSEAEAREAIEIGVNSSLNGASIFPYQKMYGRNLTNGQVQGTFDRVISYGNKRWAINYVNNSESYVRMFNITPVLYTLEMSNLPVNTIINDVSNLINSTR